MTSEIDVYRSANEVIKKCGVQQDPVEYALFRMKSLLEQNDDEGADVWKRIAYAVGVLLRTDSKGGHH